MDRSGTIKELVCKWKEEWERKKGIFFRGRKRRRKGKGGRREGERKSKENFNDRRRNPERKGRRVARLRLRKAWMDEKTGKRGRRREEERKSWVARRLKKLIGRYERENYKCKTVR